MKQETEPTKQEVLESLTNPERKLALETAGVEVDPSWKKDDLNSELMKVDGVPLVVTQEDLDENQELVDEGVKVGDIVFLPEESTESEEQSEDVQDEETADEASEQEEDLDENPAKHLEKPVWADQRLWDALSDERKQRLVNGEDFRA